MPCVAAYSRTSCVIFLEQKCGPPMEQTWASPAVQRHEPETHHVHVDRLRVIHLPEPAPRPCRGTGVYRMSHVDPMAAA